MSFRGTQAAINTALSGLQYSPRADFNGADSLTVTVNDLGNSGSGPAPDVSRVINITVRPVNDDPASRCRARRPSGSIRSTKTPICRCRASWWLTPRTPPTLRLRSRNVDGCARHDQSQHERHRRSRLGGVQNDGTSSVSLTGTPAAINATLANATGIVYKGLVNYNNYRDIPPDPTRTSNWS